VFAINIPALDFIPKIPHPILKTQFKRSLLKMQGTKGRTLFPGCIAALSQAWEFIGKIIFRTRCQSAPVDALQDSVIVHKYYIRRMPGTKAKYPIFQNSHRHCILLKPVYMIYR
jgi:hypothetical protein